MAAEDQGDAALIAAAAALLRLETALRAELGGEIEAVAFPLALLRAAVAREAFLALEAAILVAHGEAAADPLAAPLAALRAALSNPAGEPSSPLAAAEIDTAAVLNDLEDLMEALLIQRQAPKGS